jgi:hypothetical protein
MRRTVSVLLFVIGGWMLVSGTMVAWMNVGQSGGMELAMILIFWVISAPFLLLGVWASPGDRAADLGLTLMIAAAVGAAVAVMMFAFLHDPSFLRMMPPDQKIPKFEFAPVPGIADVVVVAGIGWLLYRLRAGGQDNPPLG